MSMLTIESAENGAIVRYKGKLFVAADFDALDALVRKLLDDRITVDTTRTIPLATAAEPSISTDRAKTIRDFIEKHATYIDHNPYSNRYRSVPPYAAGFSPTIAEAGGYTLGFASGPEDRL